MEEFQRERERAPEICQGILISAYVWEHYWGWERTPREEGMEQYLEFMQSQEQFMLGG